MVNGTAFLGRGGFWEAFVEGEQGNKDDAEGGKNEIMFFHLFDRNVL